MFHFTFTAIAAEVDTIANRVAESNFDESQVFQSVTDLTDTRIQELADSTVCNYVLIIFGFPCKDVSRLKYNRI